MKKINAIIVVSLISMAVAPVFSQTGEQAAEAYTTAGAPLEDTALSDAKGAAALYEALQESDTLQTGFTARVTEVCQAKGCWMRLELADGQQVMVRFKDYGFFVPKDIAGREVAVQGKAYLSEVPEAERRHLARDAGLPEEEVLRITGPGREAGFEATGVRIYN